jgi:hypothetical protein
MIGVKEKDAWERRIICQHSQKRIKKATSDPILPRGYFSSRGKGWPHMTPSGPQPIDHVGPV